MGKCICKDQPKTQQTSDIFVDMLSKDSVKKFSQMSKIKTMATFHRTKKFLKVKTLKFENTFLHMTTEKMIEQKNNLKSFKRNTTSMINNKKLQLYPNCKFISKERHSFFSLLPQKSITDSSNFMDNDKDSGGDESGDKEYAKLLPVEKKPSCNKTISNNSIIKNEDNDDDKFEYSNLPITFDEEQTFFNNIKQNILFINFTEETFNFLMETSEGLVVEQGNLIYKEGDEGNVMYMIKSGTVELLSEKLGYEKKKLGSGDCFGEIALLQMNVIRYETAKALTKVELLSIEGEMYRTEVKREKNSNPKEKILNYMEDILWVKYLERYTKFNISLMVEVVTFKKGETVIEKNQFSIDNCYLIQKGCLIYTEKNKKRYISSRELVGDLEVFLGLGEKVTYEITAMEDTICYSLSKQSLLKVMGNKYQEQILMTIFNKALQDNSFFQKIIMKNQIDSVFRLNVIKQYSPGDVVFETSKEKNKKVILILKGSISNQSAESLLGKLYGEEIITMSTDLETPITSTDNLTCLEVSWKSIRNNMKRFAETTGTLDISKTAKILSKTRVFGLLSDLRLLEMSSMFTEMKKYKKDDILIQRDSPIDSFYLITKGRVVVMESNKITREISKGNSFGEFFLLNDITSSCIVKALEDVECYKLPKESFLKCLENDEVNDYLRRKMCLEDSNIELKDLFLISHLGKGKYGNVHLVHTDYFIYAIKSVQLSFTRNDKILGKYLVTEKKLLYTLDHPFIVKLVKTFKKDTTCFFLMEYINGINIEKYVLQRNKQVTKKTLLTPRSIWEAKFYGGCLFLALDYLHHKMICHRDIKPSNLMIDQYGYLKMIDFGAAKVIKDITFTIAGTPNCIAPEVLLGKGYSFPCDFWSAGIVLFYIIYGQYPYKHNTNVMELYKEVVNGVIEYPEQNDSKSKEVVAFLQKLLRKNPIGRIWSLNKIMEEPFYEDFQWKDLKCRKFKKEDIPYIKAEYSQQEITRLMTNFSMSYENVIDSKLSLTMSNIILGDKFIFNSILDEKNYEGEVNQNNQISSTQATKLLSIYNKYLDEF